MNTEYTTSPAEAAAYIRSGQIVAFPTETVYGLGADAFNPSAVRAIFAAKGRPSDNPLIVHVDAVDRVTAVAASVPPAARALMDAFFPGPLTLILPRHPDVPPVVTAGLDTVGVRMPAHSAAQAFLGACDRPVAAPSANRSGRPSPTTWEAVAEDLDGRIPCILQGGRTDAGVESTVVDCTQAQPVVLRPGAVSLEALQAVVPAVQMAEDASKADAEVPRSPGTRHRHYAPSARVEVVTHPPQPNGTAPEVRRGYIGLEAPENTSAFSDIYVAGSVEEYAHALFHFFRTCDAHGCDRIYAQHVADEGLGRALNDRLARAAER